MRATSAYFFRIEARGHWEVSREVGLLVAIFRSCTQSGLGFWTTCKKTSILQEHVVLEGNTISSDLKSEKTQDVRRESYLLASNFTDSRVLLRFAESSICYETGPTSAGPVLQFLIFLYVSHSMLTPLLIVVIFCAPISKFTTLSCKQPSWHFILIYRNPGKFVLIASRPGWQ